MKNKIAFYLAMIAIIIGILASIDNSCKNEIKKQVEAINGEVVSIDTVGIFENDPLPYGGKNASKYKFTYKQDNKTKIGYVCFGWNDTWIMEYEEVK